MNSDPRMETRVLHEANDPDAATGATAPSLFLSTAFAHETAEELESLFAGRAAGYVYSRIQNPTVERFERRACALEDGLAAVSCASGMAAISLTALTLAGAGDEVVCGDSLFGGTRSLLDRTLRRWGIVTRFVPSTDMAAFAAAIGDRTRLIFVEAIGNPKLDVPDLAALGALAAERGVALAVDTTAATPMLLRAKDYGAAIVLHSASKYLGGHGTAVGGIVVDTGAFDWSCSRYAHLQPFAARAGRLAFVAALRTQYHRDLGGCLSPFNAFLLSLGLDTLALRMERHCANAAAVARALAADPRVSEVRYPGLPSHPDHAIAARQFGGRFGGLLAVRLGDKARAFRFINALKRARNVANLGDARTLVIHPASTFCRDATPDERRAMGVTEDLVRLSIGLEHADDIWEDIAQALGQC
jgi:O-acetylhomoserine (thiol)-lyase